ncbi:hypothetical protein CB1_001567001 [Camelus ferus]|nr:hypothetical protein CB1_001567001 [Camelus ferus]
MPKKANRIKPRNQKTRRRKKGIPWIVHIFSHQCYVAAITGCGCSSCHWKVKQEKKSELGSCCCSWVQRDGRELDHTFLDLGTWAGSCPHEGSSESSGLGMPGL